MKKNLAHIVRDVLEQKSEKPRRVTLAGAIKTVTMSKVNMSKPLPKESSNDHMKDLMTGKNDNDADDERLRNIKVQKQVKQLSDD